MAGIRWFNIKDRDLATPPGSPADGDKYIVASGGTGAWSGKDDQIAVWLAILAAWQFTVPVEGDFAYLEDENAMIWNTGSAWGGGVIEAATFKNLLSNLAVSAGINLTLSAGAVLALTSAGNNDITLTSGQDIQLATAAGKLVRALNILKVEERLRLPNKATPGASPADGDVEYEDGELWFYDGSRSKWLSVAMSAVRFVNSANGIVVVTQLNTEGNSGSKWAPWIPLKKTCIVGYAARATGGTVTNTNILVYKDAPTGVLIKTVNLVGSGDANIVSSTTENIALNALQTVWAEVDPTPPTPDDSVNVPEIILYTRWERTA